MSEGAISYGGLDDVCGIFNTFKSELTMHKVCNDGLACVNGPNHEGIYEKKCIKIGKDIGETCDDISTCLNGYKCIQSARGYKTCGGVTLIPEKAGLDREINMSSKHEIIWEFVIAGIVLYILTFFLYVRFLANSVIHERVSRKEDKP